MRPHLIQRIEVSRAIPDNCKMPDMTPRGVTPLEVTPIRAFKDNYIWLLRAGRRAAVVDPGDAVPVLDHLAREGLELAAILVTHHHADHIGGLADLADGAIPVYGPDEPIEGITRRVADGDRIRIPELNIEFDVLAIPGHTRAHVGYYGAKLLFCGDTLFACGCGRVFEGTPAQMHASLARLASLPDDTKVYCAHEYTLANIAFAKAVEPDNAALAERERVDAETRRRDAPTVPSTIGLEKRTNPFLRCREPDVVAAASRQRGAPAADEVEVFAALREWKNRF